MKTPITAKALGALLRQAREFGIVELEIPGVVRFKRGLGPAALAVTPPGDGVDSEVVADVSDGEGEEGDPRFLLEKLRQANFHPNGSK